MTRRLSALMVLMLALSACPVGRQSQAIVPPGRYVALGDSFSAGEGVPPFVPGTDVTFGDHCHRSRDAYSMRLAELGGPRLALADFVACSGALGRDFVLDNHDPDNRPEPPQRLRLGADVGLVTLTFGGNDIGFGSIIQACLKRLSVPAAVLSGLPGFVLSGVLGVGTCRQEQDPSVSSKLKAIDSSGKPSVDPANLRDLMRAGLRDLYREIRRLAPKARILVLGYPHAFEDNAQQDCAHVDNTDEVWANQLADRIDQVIADNVAAAQAGIEYVKVTGPDSPFAGHGLCSLQPHFNNPDVCVVGHACVPNPAFVYNKEYLFHPNRDGQADYAKLVMAQLAKSPPSPIQPPTGGTFRPAASETQPAPSASEGPVPAPTTGSAHIQVSGAFSLDGDLQFHRADFFAPWHDPSQRRITLTYEGGDRRGESLVLLVPDAVGTYQSSPQGFAENILDGPLLIGFGLNDFDTAHYTTVVGGSCTISVTQASGSTVSGTFDCKDVGAENSGPPISASGTFSAS